MTIRGDWQAIIAMNFGVPYDDPRAQKAYDEIVDTLLEADVIRAVDELPDGWHVLELLTKKLRFDRS